ncbi:hypothetical protein BD770DRAFT_410075 [Pilaira anomala]|nr:hypothetical protein BD770DRAFT_410075 [Pilaira anomala]
MLESTDSELEPEQELYGINRLPEPFWRVFLWARWHGKAFLLLSLHQLYKKKNIASIDPKHKEAIVSAVAKISAAGITIPVNTISQQLTPTIVNGYDDTSFFIYKGVRVQSYINIIAL